MKCRTCKRTKPIEKFAWYSEKNNRRSPFCKNCRAEFISAKNLSDRYKMTQEDFDSMFEKQGGMCAICGTLSPVRLHVDHDHETGKVRGLLCQGCNSGIGYFRDNPEWLESAAKYVRT